MLINRDIICTEDLTKEEILSIIQLATKMKKDPNNKKWLNCLSHKNFIMLFFSPSVRTHLSFSTAATALGGHAQYITSAMGRFKSRFADGETIEDVAQVMSKFSCGIGIRIMENEISFYGEGNSIIREYAKWAEVPVINMADDKCHPCQAMADVMGWAEWLNGKPSKDANMECLRGKKLLLTWGKGSLARSWNSPQASLLLASRLGLNITIARPEGYDLDGEIYHKVKNHCRINNSNFNIIDDPDAGYKDADIVYSRHWLSSNAYADGRLQKQTEINQALNLKNWMTTKKKMEWTNNAIFTHPMPVDRDNEVESEIASGTRSAIYTIAENRLHIGKAVLGLTMGNLENK